MEFTPAIPVKEFKGWDYSLMTRMTCKNHPTLEWLWKGPGRNLHYVSGHIQYPECECKLDQLMVVSQS